MWFGVVTLFPEMLSALNYGVTARAFKKGYLKLDTWNPRDFATDRRKTVDDRPYGGGPGMLMSVPPLCAAIRAAKQVAGVAPVIYLSPQGAPINQQLVYELSQKERLVLVAGRYEGIDERIVESEMDMELSLGDYVLTGGELAVMVLIDAVARFIPGTLGDQQSAYQDSFQQGLLECPHYTRPESFEGRRVPPVLLQGNHASIRAWRLKQSLKRTLERRPDLLKEVELSVEQQLLLEEIKAGL